MKRSRAEKFIDEVRQLAANLPAVPQLAELCERFGLSPLETCGGEAHSKAYIDNCMRCAPRWGLTGKVEKVT